MNKQQNAALEAERVAHAPDAVFKDEFQVWWEDHGQFCRAGGGDYERTFAFQAWRHLYPMLMQARAQSAPEPVQGEAAWVAVDHDGAWSEPQTTRAHAQTLANDMNRALPANYEGKACHVIPIYTSPAKPDAELVALLQDERNYGPLGVSCQIGIVERCVCKMCRMKRIDAKLAGLKGGKN